MELAADSKILITDRRLNKIQHRTHYKIHSCTIVQHSVYTKILMLKMHNLTCLDQIPTLHQY